MRHRVIVLFFFIAFGAIAGIAKNSKGRVSFQFYGSQWSVRVSDKLHFSMPDSSSLMPYDTVLIKDTYEDCLALKSQKRLNDWAYMKMLDSLSVACYGNTDEAVLMKTYLFKKSGYDVVLLRAGNPLYMGYYTKNTVYGHSFFTISGRDYYSDGEIKGNAKINTFLIGNGKPVSFDMKEQPLLDYKRTRNRIFESGKGKIGDDPITREIPNPIAIEVSVNQNLLNFYAQYPSSGKNYDYMTRWAMMANVPLDEDVKRQIYPTLQKELAGLSQYDAVNRLLIFTQTAFNFKYDEDIWGYDRAFFAEETLFYPYTDAEDRVILLSRLVRDLVGLEVVILYYPGHLALGVHFDEEIEGASVIYNGDRFVICDTMYIGADVGEVLSLFNDEDPTRIILLYK